MRILARTLVLFLICCAPAFAAQRTYFIAADEVIWNYAPTGTNVLTGAALKPGKDQLGYSYRKIVYHGYTDQSFTKMQPVSADARYMGLLGPTIRAEVGDTIVVMFKNNSHL